MSADALVHRMIGDDCLAVTEVVRTMAARMNRPKRTTAEVLAALTLLLPRWGSWTCCDGPAGLRLHRDSKCTYENKFENIGVVQGTPSVSGGHFRSPANPTTTRVAVAIGQTVTLSVTTGYPLLRGLRIRRLGVRIPPNAPDSAGQSTCLFVGVLSFGRA